jgi:hypothetical protein
MCVSASDKIRVVIPDNLVNKSKNDNDSATKDLFRNELVTAQQYIIENIMQNAGVLVTLLLGNNLEEVEC